MCCESCGCEGAKLYCFWPARLCDECAKARTERERGVDCVRLSLDHATDIDRANEELATAAKEFDGWPSGRDCDISPACDADSDAATKKPSEPKQRMRQLMRVLLVIELLAPLRKGATLSEIAKDVRDNFGAYCKRTIERDLESLELCGLVDCVWESSNAHPSARRKRYLWCDRSFRTAMLTGASGRLGSLA